MRSLWTVGVVAGALVLSSASCEQIVKATGSTHRPAQTIFVPQDFESWPTPRFDARKGDTVNVIMEPSEPDPQGFCDHRGGSLWMNPYTDILICENIDF